MPENGSAQPHVDYYATFGLQPASPPHALMTQLSHRIAQTPPGPERHLMEQARAILGDVGKKQVYDRRLTNTYAKPWTSQELHDLAMAPSSRPASSGGLAATIAAIPRRVLAAVAGGLAILLVLIITLASCTGGGGDTPVAGDSAAPGSKRSGSGSSSATCDKAPSTVVEKAKWSRSGTPVTGYAVVLTSAHDVPSPIDTDLAAVQANSTGFQGTRLLVQYQDKNIGLVWPGRDVTRVATFAPDGSQVSNKSYEGPRYKVDLPLTFDLQQRDHAGYFHIVASDSIQIPAAASGTEDGQQYAINLMGDAFDKEVVWVLLRGGDKLYKGTLVRYRNSEIPTDPSECTPLS
ncbi:hypothetical protein [Gordonia sihwensis]|uniref:hypothetical protein n=1 Tax=Gordonia sihwensis TaxID=173559 RepID=UPI0005EFD9AC|nr:hypothetical protein [Gordonia sihwensis]KJR05083.1 hypothetical protein UG54_17585 [Gordonia sihwensis]